jgi:hypothetical protein
MFIIMIIYEFISYDLIRNKFIYYPIIFIMSIIFQ